MFEYSSKQHYTYLQWLVRFRFPPNQKSEAEDPTTGQNNNQRVWTINIHVLISSSSSQGAVHILSNNYDRGGFLPKYIHKSWRNT